ncbi:MAG: prepilin-type N-terminal cleavage/methylation domain-containing protein [Verrucomicrobiota bacterium]
MNLTALKPSGTDEKQIRRIAARVSRRRGGFTLLELMVVVGIIGVVLAMGAPTLYSFFKKEGFRRSVSDMLDSCSTARSRAILGQTTVELVFHPVERRCEVVGGPAGGWGGWASAAAFEDDVTIEMLDVNLSEYKDSEVARVRFFPNGTCDEMTLVIRRGLEWRKISLELTTGLASVEMDPNKWRY